MIVGLVAAEPAGVTVISAKVCPQIAWVTVTSMEGAGVLVVVMILVNGTHDPGGFIIRV